MKHARARSGQLALVVALTAACSASGSDTRSGAAGATSAASATDAKAATAAVAEGKGISISQKDLEQKIDVDSMMDLRQKEYELRKGALDELLGEKLMAKEAQAQGISVDDLRKREVDAKAPAPDPADVARLYAQNERRFGGIPKEQAMATVENAVRGRNRDLRSAEFRQELIKKHGVKILLQPPRHEVTVPADAPSLGPASAPVTIVEFADYQCPYCHSAQATVDEILKRYGDKVRFVHRDFPIDSIHPRANAASRASRCAGAQGKFWEYHRGLLAAAGDLSDADLKSRAQALALNVDAFASCLQDPAGEAPIRIALEDGRKLGVQATPTFFINGRRMVGARSVPDFAAVIEDELGR